jgi:hypothetical protein
MTSDWFGSNRAICLQPRWQRVATYLWHGAYVGASRQHFSLDMTSAMFLAIVVNWRGSFRIRW